MVSSGATMPARAPASMDMLQSVMRPSIEKPRIASPAYSKTWPDAACHADVADHPQRDVLGRQPGGQRALEADDCRLRTLEGSVCAASTCSTSDVPMPNASAPNAPWVEVWLSPQTIVLPGCVSPSSGPITWTIPSRPLPVA